ncbi:hypothetical protein BGX28_004121 [Mortierella sp. GBA30]|nr:hypothetical protein BGX28_004121 [Mortierella sp. GBA30]
MADSSKISPCKVSFNGDFRRFLLSRPAVWSDFVQKVRQVYSLPKDAAIEVNYTDEEGDLISLNTDSELEDVLSVHALFSQVAPVRFEIFLRGGQDIAPAAPQANPLYGSPARSDTVTSEREETPLIRSNDPQRNPFGSEHSYDGSLIEFEDAVETTTAITTTATPSTVTNTPTLDQNITYPQQDLYEATLRQEQQEAEAYKLDAPVFPSSVQGALNDEEDSDMEIEITNTDALGKKDAPSKTAFRVSPLVAPVAEFEALRMDSAPKVMDEIVASAIEQHAQEAAASARDHTEPAAENYPDPAEQDVPTEGSASSSSGDRDLLEQFQMLIQEFQHVIQNNPQLVALAGSIMNKILSNVKVNVESFASHLQEMATQVSANAHEAAAEASRSCPFNPHHENPFGPNPFRTNPFFARSGANPFSADGPEGTFSGRHPHPFMHPHRHEPGHHRGGHGGRGGGMSGHCGRGGFFGRGGHHHGWSFGSMPNMPPMPTMPTMPAMPPMPPMPPVPPCPPSEFFFGSSMSEASCRGKTVPNTKPSPFQKGFPFNSSLPDCKTQTFRFKGGRPNLSDTQAASSSPSSEKAKFVETNTANNQAASSSSSAMPGSFPQHPQMTEIGDGWTWTKLTDEPQEGDQASSRPKYGWVWNGGEDNGKNPEPTPIYVESDEEMAEHLQEGGNPFEGRGRRGGRGGFGGFFGGRGSFGPFRGRGAFHHHFHPHHHSGFDHPDHVHPHGNHHHHQHRRRRHSGSRSGGEEGADSKEPGSPDERLKRRQTFHEQRHAMMQSRKEQLQEQRQAIARHRESIIQQRTANEEQRRVEEEQRRAQEQQRREARVQEIVGYNVGRSSEPVGAGSLSAIWPSGPATDNNATHASSATPSIPGNFPSAARAEASTNAAATALNALNALDGQVDPSEFQEQISTLVGMGFEDTAELRTVVRDFGGEVEAVVEFMVTSGHR